MKLKYIVLTENKLPESRLIMDGKKEKIENKVKKKNNEIKLEKVIKKSLKVKINKI